MKVTLWHKAGEKTHIPFGQDSKGCDRAFHEWSDTLTHPDSPHYRVTTHSDHDRIVLDSYTFDLGIGA